MKITFNYEYYEILCEIVFGFNTKSTRYKIDYLDEDKNIHPFTLWAYLRNLKWILVMNKLLNTPEINTI